MSFRCSIEASLLNSIIGCVLAGVKEVERCMIVVTNDGMEIYRNSDAFGSSVEISCQSFSLWEVRGLDGGDFMGLRVAPLELLKCTKYTKDIVKSGKCDALSGVYMLMEGDSTRLSVKVRSEHKTHVQSISVETNEDNGRRPQLPFANTLAMPTTMDQENLPPYDFVVFRAPLLLKKNLEFFSKSKTSFRAFPTDCSEKGGLILSSEHEQKIVRFPRGSEGNNNSILATYSIKSLRSFQITSQAIDRITSAITTHVCAVCLILHENCLTWLLSIPTSQDNNAALSIRHDTPTARS